MLCVKRNVIEKKNVFIPVYSNAFNVMNQNEFIEFVKNKMALTA